MSEATGAQGTTIYIYRLDNTRSIELSITLDNTNILTFYTYAATGILSGIQTVNATTSTVLSQYNYTYYMDGNVHTETDVLANATTTYTYDLAGRLKTEVSPAGTYSYTYDAAGNRTSMTENGTTTTYTYDKNNRLLTETKPGSVKSYTYDANGNTLTGDGATYTYDARDRQSSYVKGSTLASYTYYPTGLRKTKTANLAITTYVWDGSNMVLEYTGSAAAGKVYVYGLTLILQGNSWYYIYNAHGDVVKYISGTGALLKTYEYDAFGEEINASSTDANPFRYAGQYFDTETGTYYLRARYYSPAMGRFTQQDAWGYGDPTDPLSLNLYVYCYGNPVLYYDPSGNIAITTLILIGSIVVGVVAATHTAVVSHKYTGKIDWNNTLLTGFSWFMLAYSMGMSAYGVYLSYCDYKGYTPVTEVSFRNTQKSLQNAANSVKSTTTGHVSGTKQHTEFAKKVNDLGNDRLKTEVSYLNGKEVPYGTKGAVRLDVVEYDANNNIVAVYDLKTGSATLTASRIDQIHKHVGRVPVIEIKPE